MQREKLRMKRAYLHAVDIFRADPLSGDMELLKAVRIIIGRALSAHISSETKWGKAMENLPIQ